MGMAAHYPAYIMIYKQPIPQDNYGIGMNININTRFIKFEFGANYSTKTFYKERNSGNVANRVTYQVIYLNYPFLLHFNFNKNKERINRYCLTVGALVNKPIKYQYTYQLNQTLFKQSFYVANIGYSFRIGGL